MLKIYLINFFIYQKNYFIKHYKKIHGGSIEMKLLIYTINFSIFFNKIYEFCNNYKIIYNNCSF